MSSAADSLTIVHVVFSSRVAGGEMHCIDLANAQAALGHRVHVIGTAGSAVEAALDPQVQFHGLRLPLLRGFRVDLLAERLGADVCHAHLGPACKAVAAVTTAARIGTLHVGYKPHHHARHDGLICVNQAQHRSLPPQRQGLSRVIYNWAPERVARAAAPSSLREDLGLAPDQLLVGSVGRLHPTKGMDLLIRAFKVRAPADAVLAILGEGQDREALEALAGGDARIRMLGFRQDVDACLASLDLFVSASREEAFPLAILEAMKAGRAVISTATQGPLEMLAGQPGQLVPVEDVAALGDALAEELGRLAALPRESRAVQYDTRPYERAEAVAKVLRFYGDVMAYCSKRDAEFDEAEHALNV